ncbi:hypothetical protein NE634_19290, partial [Lacrimispora saccharolytica]|nr:hypothetical protein [Lacrimispora saccharolytica]
FPDYLKGIYGLATSMLAPSRPVYSKFVSHKGEDTEVNLAQYAHIPLDKADALIEQNDQAANFDPVELYKARQAIRPAQEKAAEQQLEDTMHEKPSLIMHRN